MCTRTTLFAALLVGTTAAASPIDRADQLLVVVTNDWAATEGRLFRAERHGKKWTVGAPIRVVIGAGGLGWGRGLHAESSTIRLGGPVKKEGDTKTLPLAFFGSPG